MMKKTLLLIIVYCTVLIVPLPDVTAETIKIAAIFAKSGDAQMDNLYNFQGISLAVEEINNQGGLLSRQVEVIELDNQSTPVGSKMAALKATKLGVTAVIGASWSSHSLAMAPVLQKARIPMISTVSTNPKVTLEGDYIFRVCFIDPFQGEVMAQFALQDLKAQTAVILTNINSDYSIGLSQYFKKSFLQHGGKILWEGKYLEKAMDFTEVLEKVGTLQPDVVFAPSYERNGGLLIKQAVKMGIHPVFLGGDGWSAIMYEWGGKAIEGNYFSNHWHPEVPFSMSKHVQDSYRRKYGENPPIIADLPLAYDAVLVLADAIRRAQSVERAKIREALALTTDFQGATGIISFDKHGDPLNKDAVILQFAEEKVVFVKTIKP